MTGIVVALAVAVVAAWLAGIAYFVVQPLVPWLAFWQAFGLTSLLHVLIGGLRVMAKVRP